MLRTVIGIISKPDGSPWKGALVRFVLRPGSYMAGEGPQFPSLETEVATDADGELSVDLWANEGGEASSEYIAFMPNGETFAFIVPETEDEPAPDLELSELRQVYAGPSDPNYTSIAAYVVAQIAPVQAEIDAEEVARTLADAALQGEIDAEEIARANAVAAEALTRANADAAEALARGNADTTHTNAIAAEVLARTNADVGLQDAIDAEIVDRTALETDIVRPRGRLITEYANLSAAFATLTGADLVRLVFPANTTTVLTSDPVTPANVILDMQGGVIDRNGHTLTVNAPFECGDYPAFTGAGAVAWKKWPDEINAMWFGADNTAREVFDAMIESGSFDLSSATGLFVPTDEGLLIRVVGAGVAGAVLETTIEAYTSPTEVTLADAASTTIVFQPENTATWSGKEVRDPVMTSGSPTLTSATGRFDSTDAAAAITVTGAGVAGADLVTTILAYVDDYTVTLAANASTSIVDSTTNVATWGTDSLAAFVELDESMPVVDNSLGFMATARIPAGNYFVSGAGWQLNTPYSVEAPSARLNNTVTISGYPRRMNGPIVCGSPGVGFYYRRAQAGLFSGQQAIGCNGNGFQFGKTGSADTLAYAKFEKPLAQRNRGHGFAFDASIVDRAWFNACTVDSPVSRGNGGDAFNFSGTNIGYSLFLNLQAESNVGMSVTGTATNMTFVAGHHVDRVGEIAVSLTGANNQMFGGRVVGTESLGAITGFASYSATFSKSGVGVKMGAIVATNITFADGTKFRSGAGRPEASVTAPPGSYYAQTDATTGQSFIWRKATGAGNTGWRAHDEFLPVTSNASNPSVTASPRKMRLIGQTTNIDSFANGVEGMDMLVWVGENPAFSFRHNQAQNNNLQLAGAANLVAAPGMRIAFVYLTETIVANAAASGGAVSVTVKALPMALPNGATLVFSGGVTATLTAAALRGSTSITVSALSGPIAQNETATRAAWFELYRNVA